MPLSVLELFNFGGVDSRSNPLNMPPGRSLRTRNWVPKNGEMMQLRYGFSTVSLSGSASIGAYHSLIPYTFYDDSGTETPYLVLGQGEELRVLNIATGSVSKPPVRGAAISSPDGFQSYLANGKIHIGNGTDQKWFDANTFRDNGIRALTAAEIANVVLGFGVVELSAAQNASITLTPAAGGTFSATTGTGLLFYVSEFDTLTNELGPATISAGSGRITLSANQKVTVGSLPDLSAVSGMALVKLVSRTQDSLASAYFCTNTSTAITSCSRSGTTLTVISAAHGLSSGDIVSLSGTINFDSIYKVTVSDANTFTVTLFQAVGQNATGSNTTGGTCKRIVSAAAATASVDVTSPAQDMTIVANDANRGLAASDSSFTDPGYAFYASIYNPDGGGHVGNRIQIGTGRFVFTASGDAAIRRLNMRITGLPDLSGVDSEWVLMIGRTGDAAQIPYPATDTAGNFFATVSGQTAITLTTQGSLFGTGEMPTRNGVIPSALDMFAVVGDRIFGGQTGRPTTYMSASAADATAGDFVGRPEQSWAPDDIDTFPTAEGLRGMFTEDRGAFYATKNDGAILADLGTGFAWLGPWYGAGMAGKRSWCQTPYGPYWVTGNKQLATFDGGYPVAVSDEYQAALLSRIGDAHLSEVECAYIVDVDKGIDQLLINCRDSTGSPFQVIHDFKLRDARSQSGQGYESVYSAPLSSQFTIAAVRDAAGALRLWAGAQSGSIYQLHDGETDGGAVYSADAIFLINAGPNRPSVPEFRLYGDQGIAVSISRRLDASVDPAASVAFVPLQQAAVSGEDGNSYYGYRLATTELNKTYIRLQLDSHAADGTFDLNDPPHVPLETYGKIYLAQGLVGTQRGI